MTDIKTINYCWFGGNIKPELANKCIESWKKFAPGYQIIEWNESNFNINICSYVKQAYENKKYAFVSDFARFYILYNYGGIYLDTDVELIKPIDDIIKNGPFAGCEPPDKGKLFVASGLGLYAYEKMNIYKEILDDYFASNYVKNDGTFDLTTVAIRVTKYFKKHGFDENNNSIQTVSGINIYPSEYLCPLNPFNEKLEITDKTVAIHHYAGSWVSKEEQLGNHIQKKYLFFIPYEISVRLAFLIAYIKLNGLKKAMIEIYNRLRKK